MASLDTLLKTMRLEGEPGGGGEMGVTDWKRWIHLLLVTFCSFVPVLRPSCVRLCHHVQKPRWVNVEVKKTSESNSCEHHVSCAQRLNNHDIL